MKAIILAAGRGSRMKGLTDGRPKCLVELRGRPLLDWQLQSLREGGIEEIGIVTGYRRELLADRGLAEFHNVRWAETNMVSSLACAREWLVEGPCVVSYSDIFYEPQGVIALGHCPAALAVTYDRNWLSLWKGRFGDPLLDAETFRMNPDGTLAEIGNRPRSIEEVQGQYMGLLRIAPEGWREIERVRAKLSETDRDRMHMTGTLQLVVKAGRVPIAALPYDLPWGEIDSADDLALFDRPEGD